MRKKTKLPSASRPSRALPVRRADLGEKREYIAKLGDRQVRMRAMTGRELIAVQRGKMKVPDVLEMTSGAVLFPKEDLGVDDPLDLDYDQLAGLLDSWGDAMMKEAVPNSSGESSA